MPFLDVPPCVCSATWKLSEHHSSGCFVEASWGRHDWLLIQSLVLFNFLENGDWGYKFQASNNDVVLLVASSHLELTKSYLIRPSHHPRNSKEFGIMCQEPRAETYFLLVKRKTLDKLNLTECIWAKNDPWIRHHLEPEDSQSTLPPQLELKLDYTGQGQSWESEPSLEEDSEEFDSTVVERKILWRLQGRDIQFVIFLLFWKI